MFNLVPQGVTQFREFLRVNWEVCHMVLTVCPELVLLMGSFSVPWLILSYFGHLLCALLGWNQEVQIRVPRLLLTWRYTP
jgi:hypothetical protein